MNKAFLCLVMIIFKLEREEEAMNFIEQIKDYKPYNEQEERDKEVMLKFIKTFDDVLTR